MLHYNLFKENMYFTIILRFFKLLIFLKQVFSFMILHYQLNDSYRFEELKNWKNYTDKK